MATSFEITPTDTEAASLAEAAMPAWDPKGASHPRIADNDDNVVVLVPSDDAVDDRPAAERIASAVEHLPGQREVVLAVLNACRDQIDDESVAGVVAAAQRHNKSVYGPMVLCSILERAGALQHVDAEGNPYQDDDIEPEIVVEDGVEYLQAAEPPASCWVATAEGIAFAESDDPVARTRALLAEQSVYEPIYRYVLESCRGGADTKTLAGVVDAHELTQNPRVYVAHFLHQLEECGALAWRGAWTTTEVGEQILAQMTA